MAGFGDDDAIEHTLCQIRTIHVFKIPPRTTSGGYRASEWNEEVWQGSLKIVEKNKEAAILMNDPKTGALFAMCPVKEGAVERTVDSSRYFVLKIQNAQGRHAFIGVAFNEREEAFDFNVALQEFQKDLDRDEQLKNGTLTLDQGPTKDYSLKEGEKISIKLPSTGETSRRKERTRGGGGGGLLAPPPGSSGGGGLLAPPSSDTRRRTSPSPGIDLLNSAPPPPTTTNNNNNLLSGFDPLGPRMGTTPATTAPPAPSPLDAWGAFSGALPSSTAGAVKPTATRPQQQQPSSSNDPFDFLS